MSDNNLTRAEAIERARLLNVASYDVSLDLTSGETTFRSESIVEFSCHRAGAETFVDLTAPKVHEITLNGEPVDVSSFDGNRIALRGVAESNTLRVVADCAYMHTGEGLHRFVDPVDGSVYLHSQFETFDAHRVFACFDQPDLKATFTFRVKAPGDWQVISNAPIARQDFETGSWEFAPTPRISTYITAIVAGPYVYVLDEHDGIPLAIYCRKSLEQYLEPDEMFEVTKQGFDFFHRAFGYRYPFQKYDQLFVPEFNAGAMENAGCVTFTEDYIFRGKMTDAAHQRRAETVLHEMAHMWFGDLVTMRWWDDLWLNESFASYMSTLALAEATRWPQAWTTFATTDKPWAYRQDQLSSTHPIAADIHDIYDVKVNFDGITYAKGAAVLKQLVAWVGMEQFFEGMRTYFRRHEFGNTTLQDLLDVLEESSGRDLTAWSKQWLESAGLNTIRPNFSVVDDAFASFTVDQQAPPDHPMLRSHRIAIGLYDRTSEGVIRRDRVELDIDGASTEVAELVGKAQPDIVLLNDDDLSFTKVRLDERSLRAVIGSIGEFRESLPRALCWTSIWDMTRDAETAARDFLSVVLAGIDQEKDISVVQALLRQTHSAIDVFIDPPYRPTALARLAAAARERVFAAEPGSDRQLEWTRAFARAARSEDDVATVRGLLDGTVDVPGLEVDVELRWHLLNCLVVIAQAGETEIEAELKRDSTAAGERHAARARAALPNAQAKAAAWASVMDSDALPNALQTATILGFQQTEDNELLRPYASRYFDSLVEVWHTRTTETAQTIVVGLYPAALVEQETIEMTERFLSDDSIPPALRRLVAERRDDVIRALKARERDRQAA